MSSATARGQPSRPGARAGCLELLLLLCPLLALLGPAPFPVLLAILLPVILLVAALLGLLLGLLPSVLPSVLPGTLPCVLAARVLVPGLRLLLSRLSLGVGLALLSLRALGLRTLSLGVVPGLGIVA